MGVPKTIVMATGNAGKVREIAVLLEPLGSEVIAQSAFDVIEAEESGETFEANALIKAQHAAAVTGLPAIADDSGLAVDALGGRPGVYSARYAGPAASDDDNIAKLLDALQGERDRAAAFHCAACFVDPAREGAVITHGIWRGEILAGRRGDGGFGYDPIFLDPDSGLASAELTAQEKNARSHRGKALRALVSQLAERYAD